MCKLAHAALHTRNWQLKLLGISPRPKRIYFLSMEFVDGAGEGLVIKWFLLTGMLGFVVCAFVIT